MAILHIPTLKSYWKFSNYKENVNASSDLRKISNDILRSIKFILQLTELSDSKVHPDLNNKIIACLAI